MMQQDTFWRKNLFDLNLESNMAYDALFDQIGIDEKSKRAEWVNGREIVASFESPQKFVQHHFKFYPTYFI